MTLVAGLLAATTVCGHETSGRHGGRVTDAGKFHVEVVTKGEIVDVFRSDEGQKPVPSASFKGTAILLVGAKAARVPLEPADGNRLTGKAATALSASPEGAVHVTGPDGATARAFSDEVDAGSSQKMRQNQRSRARHDCNAIVTCSSGKFN